jgi:O-antigen/teichoic acid export membrane protein
LILALNILFFVFAELIAYVLFGEKFIESWKILQYSILFLIFNFLLQINFHIFAWIGKIKERLKIILIAIVFNIITNYILIWSIGVYGAALSTWLGWILIWILSEIRLDAIYRSKWDIIFLLKNSWFFILIWIISYIYLWSIHENISRGFWLIFLVCFSLLYFWIIWIINKKEVHLLISEIKKIRA